jgi:uncharacterized protein YycO
MNAVSILKPGDLIFYPDDGNWKHRIFSWLQKIGGEMGKMTYPGYTHVAMVSTEPDLAVEMVWPRPRFRFIADDIRAKVIYRPMCGDIIKTRAISWCYLNIGEHYSFIDMVLGRMGLLHCHQVCSGWVDEAYKKAGFPLTSVKETLVSPNELASSGVIDYVMRTA